MAVITKTIKASGGDYTSASAWEAAQQGDLVTLAEIHVGECYTMTDTTAFTIAGSVTNSSYYMKLIGASGQSYVLGATATPVLTLSNNNTRIEDIRVNGTSGVASQTGIYISGANLCQIKRCIVQKTGAGGGSNVGIDSINSGNTQYIIACLVYDWNLYGISDGSSSGTYYVVSNCLIHNCGTGFFANATAARAICKNVAIQSATTYFGGSYNTTASKNNIAEDASSPGGSGTNGAIAFVDEAADDFHIDTATDTVALDVGADLSADADFAFNYDLEGTAFGTWDRGCYSATASGGGTALLKIIAETAQVSDGYLRRMAMTRPVSEAENITESILRRGVLRRIISETINVTEALLRRGALKRIITETQNLTEGVVKSISTLIIKVVNEGVQIAEAIARRLGLTRIASESVSLPETAVRRGALRRILNETASITEGVLRRMAMVKIAAETVSLVETAVRRVGLVRIVSETLNIAEGVLKYLGLVKIVNEGLNIIEGIMKKLGLDTLGILGENLTLVFTSISRGIKSISNKRGIISKTPKREVKP